MQEIIHIFQDIDNFKLFNKKIFLFQNLLNIKNNKRSKKIKICSKITEKDEKKKIKCIRRDGKIFDFPRRFSKKKCKGKVRGFSMKSSCAPFK